MRWRVRFDDANDEMRRPENKEDSHNCKQNLNSLPVLHEDFFVLLVARSNTVEGNLSDLFIDSTKDVRVDKYHKGERYNKINSQLND